MTATQDPPFDRILGKNYSLLADPQHQRQQQQQQELVPVKDGKKQKGKKRGATKSSSAKSGATGATPTAESSSSAAAAEKEPGDLPTALSLYFLRVELAAREGKSSSASSLVKLDLLSRSAALLPPPFPYLLP